MVDGWPKKSKAYSDYAFPISALLLILFFLSGISGLLHGEAGAQSQSQGQPKESEVWEVTLKLGGQSCDVNSAESAVLHLEGIMMVDIESRKGYLIVAYDPSKVSPNQMLQAVGKKRGEGWFCTATVVGLSQQ